MKIKFFVEWNWSTLIKCSSEVNVPLAGDRFANGKHSPHGGISGGWKSERPDDDNCYGNSNKEDKLGWEWAPSPTTHQQCRLLPAGGSLPHLHSPAETSTWRAGAVVSSSKAHSNTKRANQNTNCGGRRSRMPRRRMIRLTRGFSRSSSALETRCGREFTASLATWARTNMSNRLVYRALSRPTHRHTHTHFPCLTAYCLPHNEMLPSRHLTITKLDLKASPNSAKHLFVEFSSSRTRARLTKISLAKFKPRPTLINLHTIIFYAP